MWKLYELMKGSSILIRQFMMPNPFEGLQYAELYNWGAGFALYPFTYLIVGLFYSGGSNSALGSFLYLFFYAVHTWLIMLVGYFNFSTLAIVLIVWGYIAVLVVIKRLQYSSFY